MEITRNNFDEKWPCIQEAIASADFLAIDGEFTGLSHDSDNRNSAFDTPAERYAKTRDSANKFLLVQFGLCTFHRSDKGKLTNQVFNFYVWPRPYSRLAPDLRFMCQTSSIDFLASNDFDFNKLFKDGIPYLRPGDKAVLLEKFQDRKCARETQANSPMVVVPQDQKDVIDEVNAKVEKFLLQTDADEKLVLEGYNSFQRRLIYNSVKPRFSQDHSFHMETVKGKSDRDRNIVIFKADAGAQKKMESERDEAELKELEAAFGFSKVIQEISNSGKIVVGHNMLLDLCHIMQQFIAPLPADYDQFKGLVVQTFPKIVDTKLLASTSPLKEDIPNSSLEELLKSLNSSPFKMPKVERESDHSGYQLGDDALEKYHNAGYDAFITGLCFMAMRNRLEALANSEEKNVQGSKLIAPFLNKLFLMRVMDVPYMNLAGPEVEPDRDHVFHLTFPSEWKQSDLYQLFAAFGPIKVNWLSDTTAYVSLREHVANAKVVVMSTLNSSSVYKILPYSAHKKMEAQVLLSSSGAAFQNTGITPTLEKASIFHTPKQTESKKRSAPTTEDPIKRTKSVSEEPHAKIFEDQSWGDD